MPGNISTDLANKLLSGILRNVAYEPALIVYAALYTTDPTDDDVGIEVSTEATGYERMPVVFTDPDLTPRETENDVEVEFPEATASWGTITHVGIRTADVAGDLLFFGPLTVEKTIGIGDQPRFKAGTLVAGFLASV